MGDVALSKFVRTEINQRERHSGACLERSVGIVDTFHKTGTKQIVSRNWIVFDIARFKPGLDQDLRFKCRKCRKIILVSEKKSRVYYK